MGRCCKRRASKQTKCLLSVIEQSRKKVDKSLNLKCILKDIKELTRNMKDVMRNLDIDPCV